MTMPEAERDAAVVTRALSPFDIPGPDGPTPVLTRVRTASCVRPGMVMGWGEVRVRHERGTTRRLASHVLALARTGERTEAVAVRLEAPEPVAARLVAHALLTFAAADVDRLVAEGNPPGGHPAWGRVLGWDREAVQENRARLAVAVAQGCEAWLAGGGHPAAVDELLGELNAAAGVRGRLGLRRVGQAVRFAPASDVMQRWFWNRLLAGVSPSELEQLGPAVHDPLPAGDASAEAGAEHGFMGAWVLRPGRDVAGGGVRVHSAARPPRPGRAAPDDSSPDPGPGDGSGAPLALERRRPRSNQPGAPERPGGDGNGGPGGHSGPTASGAGYARR